MRKAVVVLSLTVAVSALSVAPIVTAQDRGYSRKSDVIYGRTAGLALTMEVFTPTQANGRGVIWIVSGGGYSSRDRTLHPSFEARIAPLLTRGYTIFAAIHGSSPVFNLQDYVQDARRAVRFVRHHAGQFGVDPARLAIGGSSSGGIIALLIAMKSDAGAPASEDPVERASSRVQAAGVFFPATDLANFGENGGSQRNPGACASSVWGRQMDIESASASLLHQIHTDSPLELGPSLVVAF